MMIVFVFLIVTTTSSLVFQDLRAGWLALAVIFNFGAFVIAWRSVFGKRLSYVDPGLVFLAVVLVYSVIPLLTVEVMNFNFGAMQDSRLYHIALDDGIISTTIASANAIIAGFGAAYLAIRKPQMPIFTAAPSNVVTALWVMFGVGLLTRVGLALSGSSSGDYADEYLLIQSLPLLVIQIVNILTNAFYVALFGLTAHYLFRQNVRVAVALVLFSVIVLFQATSARTPLALIIFGTVVCWDAVFRRISPLAIALLSSVAIALFLAAGALRGGIDSIAIVFARSEFMGVFVTALDVRQIYLTGASVGMNLTLFFSDLVRLVPQQILPVEKIDPASWYVTTFYPEYAASGGGFAFGMLAEAALSGGFLAALIRGLALGIVLTASFNLLTKRSSIWTFIIYVWLLTSTYQCFRDTTFTLAGRFVFQFLPAILLTVAVAAILKGRTGASR